MASTSPFAILGTAKLDLCPSLPDEASNLTPAEREEQRYADYLHRQFYGRGETKWLIYAGKGWSTSWGTPPMLGVVYADNEFLAERLAAERGILNPNNATFKPLFKNGGKSPQAKTQN
jgi:hypothetical protein